MEISVRSSGSWLRAVTRSAGALRLSAYCDMGNHWHLVLRTTADGALSPFMNWLRLIHTQRYRVAHGNVDDGPVHQGRFKSFVVQTDRHFRTVCRYVERNAARASLVQRAEQWRWSSLWRWVRGVHGLADGDGPPLVLSPWPTPSGTATATDGSGRPRRWLRTVNMPLAAAELEALRIAAYRCRPFGGPASVERMIRTHGLESTDRRPGRPPAGST